MDSMNGALHPGIDFGVDSNTTFYAVADGYVENVYTGFDNGNTLCYGILLRVSKDIIVQYNFEPFNNKSQEFTPEQQRKFIYVDNGEFIRAGQPIGTLVYFQHATHLHFGVQNESMKVFISPIWFFNETIRNTLEEYYENISGLLVCVINQ